MAVACSLSRSRNGVSKAGKRRRRRLMRNFTALLPAFVCQPSDDRDLRLRLVRWRERGKDKQPTCHESGVQRGRCGLKGFVSTLA